MEGSAVLPRQLLDRPMPYKYVVVKGTESTLYEFIYKRQDKESKQHVNRCLHLRSALLGSGGASRAAAGTQASEGGGSRLPGPLCSAGPHPRPVYKPEFGSEFPSV